MPVSRPDCSQITIAFPDPRMDQQRDLGAYVVAPCGERISKRRGFLIPAVTSTQRKNSRTMRAVR